MGGSQASEPPDLRLLMAAPGLSVLIYEEGLRKWGSPPARDDDHLQKTL